MLGFFIKRSKGCQVIPEISLDNNGNLQNVINSIPYSQNKCSICLNDFLDNLSKISYYDITKECLNMEWFKSRILILKCNHIFHLCCFTRHIKHQYETYMFSKFEIDINEIESEIRSNIESEVESSEVESSEIGSEVEFTPEVEQEFTPKVEQEIERISEKQVIPIENIIVINEQNVVSLDDDTPITYISDDLPEIHQNKEDNDCTRISKEMTNELIQDIITNTKSDTGTQNSKYGTFKMECPLCKDKMNCFLALSVLEKYKILLELYS